MKLWRKQKKINMALLCEKMLKHDQWTLSMDKHARGVQANLVKTKILKNKLLNTSLLSITVSGHLRDIW